MDTRTGAILRMASLAGLAASEQKHYIPMKVPPTLAQRTRGKVGRNDPCPCGSGKKFKKCHLYGKT